MNKINFLLRRLIKFFGGVRIALGSILFFGLAAAIAALFFLAWLTEEVIEGGTTKFDASAREYVHAFAAPPLTVVMQAASVAGSTLFLALLGTIVTVIFCFLRRRRAAAIFTITTVGAAILISLLKVVFRRHRPEPFFDTVLPVSYSFPSGHSLGSFCFYAALAAIVTARVKSLRLKIVVWTTAAFLIALVGISRVYLGVHYPSDVLAGYAVGIVWVVTIAVGDRLMRIRNTKIDSSENEFSD